jgi:Squalene-hopene cyclase C-terminal domain/Prenyltransferase and squalene oxidase repeat
MGLRSCGAILGAVAISAATPCLAPGASPGPETTGHLEPTVSFLQSAQNSDGGFGASVGSPSDPDISAWVALALAAASINPQYQTAPGGRSVFQYLEEHAGELRLTPDLERALLVVDAAGTPANDFGDVNLTAELLERKLLEGSFPHQAGDEYGSVIDTAFAVLALSPIHEQAVERAVREASEWLIREQNPDGSWPSSCPRTVPSCNAGGGEAPQGEVDSTAATIEALNAAGMRNSEAQQKALGLLREMELAGGGFVEFANELEPNTASTAWTVQALWSAGEQPESEAWTKGGGDPLQYLASMQQPEGSIRWRASEDSYPVWMTAYVTPAFAGQALPIPPVAAPAQPPQAAPAPEPAGSGAASAPPSGPATKVGLASRRRAARPKDGVRTGGGGTGAQLFSRPQPQSEGNTRGGARQLERSVARSASKRPRARPRQAATTAGDGHDRRGSAARSGHGKPVGGSTGGGAGAADEQVTGLLVDAPGSKRPGAPGLRSASGVEAGAPWTALAIAALVGLLAMIGALVERWRPQVSS